MTFLTYYFEVFSLLLRREIFLACKAPSIVEVWFTINEQFPSGQETAVTGTLIIPLNIYCPILFFEETYNFIKKYWMNKKQEAKGGRKDYFVSNAG